MQSHTRHQLKEDKFATATKDAVHWSVDHRNPILIVAIVAAIALAAGLGYQYVMNEQEEKASLALGNAMRTAAAPLRSPETAADPYQKSFLTSKDRAAATYQEFLKAANDFPRTRNGKYALYMAGVSAMALGDSANAEKHLKESSASGKEVSGLARMALAALYRSQKKEKEAAALYQEVITASFPNVPKASAQLELASLYESGQPLEAIKVYEAIQKDAETERKAEAGESKPKTDKATPAIVPEQKSPLEELAASKIAELKKVTVR